MLQPIILLPDLLQLIPVIKKLLLTHCSNIASFDWPLFEVGASSNGT